MLTDFRSGSWGHRNHQNSSTRPFGSRHGATHNVGTPNYGASSWKIIEERVKAFSVQQPISPRYSGPTFLGLFVVRHIGGHCTPGQRNRGGAQVQEVKQGRVVG